MTQENNKDNSNLSSSASGRRTGGIIYNVTIKVERTIADAWLQWLLKEHIPSVMQTNCFVDYKLVRLLEVDDSEGPTYAIQYHADSKSDYSRYMEMYSSQISRISFERWGEQFIAFRSVMEVVQ